MLLSLHPLTCCLFSPEFRASIVLLRFNFLLLTLSFMLFFSLSHIVFISSCIFVYAELITWSPLSLLKSPFPSLSCVYQPAHSDLFCPSTFNTFCLYHLTDPSLSKSKALECRKCAIYFNIIHIAECAENVQQILG